MGSNDEIFEDEEVILVYVEFEGLVDSNVFNEKQLQLDMIGVDTEYPIMQINGRFYEGTYEDVCGTNMFFTKDDNSTVCDPVFDTVSNLKYFAKTRKCLKMRRIFIKPRTEVLGDSEHDQCVPNLDTLKQAGIPFQYQKQALSFWETMRNNRLNALHSYLEKQRIRQQKKSQGIILESESDEDNPFAIYNHKEDTNYFNKSEDTCVDSEKESNYCDNQSYPKDIYETQNISKDSCQNDDELDSLTESESSIVKGDGCRSLRSIKTYKTVVVCKKNLNIAGNKRKIKPKSKRPSLKKKTLSFNAKEKKLSNEKESEKSQNTNLVKTLSSLEITVNKHEERSKKCKAVIVETSKLENNQTDSNKTVEDPKGEHAINLSEQLQTIMEGLSTKMD